MSRTLVFVALAVFAVVALLPIVVMLPRIEAADLTDLLSQRTLGLLGRTLLLGLGTAGLALLIGVPFGYLVARTDVPGASLLRTLGVVPLLLPPLILAITWTVFLPEAMPSPAQAIFVLGLSTFPLVAVFTARAAERIDARLEEAALLAGGLRAVLRMELPLVAPAAACGACLAFAFAVNDFGVPDYVSSVGPRKFNVYADEITLNWNLARQPGKPVATALPLILLTLGTLVPALRLRRRGALATLGHGFQQPRALKLGLLRWPAFVFSGAVVVLAGLVPIARLAWEASASTQAGHSLAAFRDAMARAMELARVDLRNSFVYATCTALAAVLLGLVLGHAIERARRAWAGRSLELLALLPLAAPAILFGIGIINLWNREATAALYDGGAMVVILQTGRFVIFPILIVSGAVAALDPALEEAAALAGAGPVRRLAGIVAPCLRGSLVAGFVLVFVFAMRDLDSAIILPAANKTAIFRVFNMVHFGRDAHVAALALLLIFAILLPGLLWSLFARKRLEVLP